MVFGFEPDTGIMMFTGRNPGEIGVKQCKFMLITSFDDIGKEIPAILKSD